MRLKENSNNIHNFGFSNFNTKINSNMKNLLNLLLLSMTLICFASCGDDDESSSDCTGILESGGEMKIDGGTFNLSIAQLLISSGFDGDIYLFQVGGISSDCNNVKTLSFSIEIPKDTEGLF
jgi:hypothetical protein